MQLHLAVAYKPPRCAWSWRLVPDKGAPMDGTGVDPGASAYRLRLHALLQGLIGLDDGVEVEVVTTDASTIEMAERWLPSWEANGFRKKGIESIDLVRDLAVQLRRVRVSFRHQPRRTGDMHAKDCSRHAKQAAADMPADALPVTGPALVREDVSVVAWTDGGSRKNPGPSGWGVVMVHLASGGTLQVRGGADVATNNRMELMAIAEALTALTRPTRIEIRSDSKFSISVCTQWMAGWKRRGWRKVDGDEPVNLDVVRRLDELLARPGYEVVFTWVRGHSGEPGNELADLLCNHAIDAVIAGEDPAWQERLAAPPFVILRGSS